jgi:hypothetical protein
VPGPKVIDAFSDERGCVDMRRLQEHLTSSGLLPAVQSFWRDQIGKIRNVEGNWLLWTRTVTDKAARILAIWGHSATPEEIVNAIDEAHDMRATRSRLFEDERFTRVDKTRVGLRSWELEEYSTIAEEMGQEIDRLGGTANLGSLIAALVGRFHLREASIRVYVNAPMFVLEGDTIRRRTNTDAHDAVAAVTDTAGCYPLGPDALAWRLDVSTDTLRGSGRLMPAAIAAWLGVMPGGRRSLTADGGTVGVTWPETSPTGPSIGSIRFLVERAEGRTGRANSPNTAENHRINISMGKMVKTAVFLSSSQGALRARSNSQRIYMAKTVALRFVVFKGRHCTRVENPGKVATE